MSKVFVEDTEMQDIANAIREKNGTDTKYLPSEMSEAIRNIVSESGLPEMVEAIACGTLTTTSAMDTCFVTHNMGVKPDFAVMWADVEKYSDITPGSCISCVYMRSMWDGENSSKDEYPYIYNYKHPTSNNKSAGTYTILKSEVSETEFNFGKGGGLWAPVDVNGNPVTYKWCTVKLK